MSGIISSGFLECSRRGEFTITEWTVVDLLVLIAGH
jgi:hypothetical protein